MVKKASYILIAVLFFVSIGFCRPNITFQGMGGGGHGTFAVISENHFARDDFTGGFGLRGIVELRLGNFGLVHYTPSLTFWLTRREWTVYPNPGYYTENDERETQIAINLFDVKYIFDTPKESFKPYAGISVLPCIIINRYHDKWVDKDANTNETLRSSDDPDTDPSIGFNAFGGVDFPIKDRIIPFIEVRFTATKEWAFKTHAGMLLWF
jgi:hypothetical protein